MGVEGEKVVKGGKRRLRYSKTGGNTLHIRNIKCQVMMQNTVANDASVTHLLILIFLTMSPRSIHGVIKISLLYSARVFALALLAASIRCWRVFDLCKSLAVIWLLSLAPTRSEYLT